MTIVEVVVVGEWRYADTQTRQVVVLRTNYDFWYEIAKADGKLESDEQPSLNADGFRYYLLYDTWPEGGQFWPDGIGSLTEQDAKEAAEKMLPSPVRWLAELPTPPRPRLVADPQAWPETPTYRAHELARREQLKRQFRTQRDLDQGKKH